MNVQSVALKGNGLCNVARNCAFLVKVMCIFYLFMCGTKKYPNRYTS